MVAKCCIVSLIIKYKLPTVLTVVLLTLIFSSYLKLPNKLYNGTKSNYLFTEHVDVVYTWVNGSDPLFLQSLQEHVKRNFSGAHDYSNQRYDDKYELKFSLRSLEKYAPWIRHVYIVTNGQIPYWLNLDYEKVSLVTHKDIFTDTFDLPSFSSPAIESHLHRIPGLSKYFIYFNDDVFLGAPMYVDDFVSPSRGFLVYLAWPLPMCSVDCPWVYVGDGQCDSACYNANCQMDGNDCDVINKFQSPWDEKLLPFLSSKENLDGPIVHNHTNTSHVTVRYLHQLQTKDKPTEGSYKNATLRLPNFNPPPVLNNSKIALKIEPTLANPRLLLHNATNLTDVIEQHNKNVMLHNKLSRRKRTARKHKYRASSNFSGRHREGFNTDMYGASLQYTNRVYNLKFGFKSRYVPAHAPILIDKDIMNDMQLTFGKELRRTSRNRIRSENDMQFAFSYYYFMMNTRQNLSITQIFDRFDTDSSGTWSDREIRTILTKIYELPLSYATVDHFEDVLLNCSKQGAFPEVTTPEFERYVDSKLPTVSKELVTNCPLLEKILTEHFSARHKYRFEIINNAQSSHVIFKMLNSNISEVVGHLDEIRRHTKKFICLNDNLDESKLSDNDLIRAVLYDFYLSLFPKPSKFELPADFRNRFLYLEELNQWKSYHFKLKLCTYFCIFILCYVTYCNLFKRRILYRFVNKIFC